MGAAAPLLIIALMWQFAHWSWKVRPLVPLLLGLLVLAAAFGANIYLNQSAAESRRVIAQVQDRAKEAELAVLVDTAQANEQLAKLLEFLTIPLGVSLIVAAILWQADLQFNRRILRHDEEAESLLEDRAQLERLRQEIGPRPGPEELDRVAEERWDRLDEAWRTLRRAEREFEKRYRTLLHERHVQPLDRRRRHRDEADHA